jgi:allantoinase
MADCIVRGGVLVQPSGIVRADLAIEGGRIVEIGPELPGGAEEIDARGLTVFPGVIDDHLHFNEPGRAEWEGAASGSAALAAGGGTAFFDMPLNSTPCTVNRAAFEEKQAALERASVTDFALWGGLVPGNLGELAPLAECGAIGFKAFLSDSGLPEFPRSDDLTLYEGMREAARLGLPVAVHAESEEITSRLTQRARQAGRLTARDYLASRPIVAEVEAIHRAALLAREAGCKLHVVHISSAQGVIAALEARALGTDIAIETCAHYLFFTEEDLFRLGAIAKCAPPLRDRDEREKLWAHVLYGSVDVVASDHSPAPPAMKTGDDFFAIWGGIAGVQSTLAVLLEAGHFERAVSLERIAELTAGYPARRFYLRNKGGIAAGNDADLTLVDLNREYVVDTAGLFQKHRLSPYAGSRFRGAIRRTMLRGTTIFHEGRITVKSGGQLLRPKVQATYATSRIHP